MGARLIAFAGALVVALLLASPATGAQRPASKTLHGEVGGTGKVIIEIVFVRGDERLIRKYNFTIRRLPLRCERGLTTDFSFSGGNAMANNNPDKREFGIGAFGNGDRWFIEGHLRKAGVAVGRAQARLSDVKVGDDRVDCSSGEVHWVAD